LDIANIDQSLAAGMSDPTLNNVIQQYFQGPITSTSLPSRRSDAPVDATYTRDSVSRTLDQLYSSGQLAAVDFPNVVINLLLPPGTILDTTAAGGVGDLDDKDSSLQGLGGYHGSHVAPDGTVIYFAAAVYSQQTNSQTNGIPVWPDSWKNVVATLYHELNEARTDADVEEAMRRNNDNLLGWYSQSGGEIGDIPINEAGNDLHSVFVEGLRRRSSSRGTTGEAFLITSSQTRSPLWRATARLATRVRSFATARASPAWLSARMPSKQSIRASTPT
jgi:hypothetical protein